MWEHGDDYSDFAPQAPHSDNDSPLSSPPMTPISVQPTTPGITAPLTTMSLASQSPAFWPDVFTPQVAKAKSGRPKKITIFRSNQYSQSTASLNTSYLHLENATNINPNFPSEVTLPNSQFLNQFLDAMLNSSLANPLPVNPLVFQRV